MVGADIQVVNDYDRDVFNGDQGHVVEVGLNNSFLKVAFKAAKAVSPTSDTPAAASTSSPSSFGHAEPEGGQPLKVIEYTGRQVDMLELAWVTTV